METEGRPVWLDRENGGEQCRVRQRNVPRADHVKPHRHVKVHSCFHSEWCMLCCEIIPVAMWAGEAGRRVSSGPARGHWQWISEVEMSELSD